MSQLELLYVPPTPTAPASTPALVSGEAAVKAADQLARRFWWPLTASGRTPSESITFITAGLAEQGFTLPHSGVESASLHALAWAFARQTWRQGRLDSVPDVARSLIALMKHHARCDLPESTALQTAVDALAAERGADAEETA